MADKKKADEYLGGMSGQAANAIRGRQKQIDDAVDNASSGKSPNSQPDTGVDGRDRPPPRKRWYE